MYAPLSDFREALASCALQSQGLSEEALPDIARQIRRPERGRGDLALPCFPLARAAGKNPAAVAEAVATAAKSRPEFVRVEATGPYVNVDLCPAALARAVLAVGQQQDFGRSQRGAGKTVVVEFSSPNIAKPLGFHHIRSTVIGAALARLYAADGWKVEAINYLGDWGKQFGLLATGFERHGDPARLEDAAHLVEVYVKANAEADVARRQATIARPQEAQALLSALKAQRDAAASSDDEKSRRKAEKSQKSLEKKLRALGTDADPIADPEAFLRALDEQAETARAELPRATELDQAARQFLARMEAGDDEALGIWTRFRAASIADFERVYDRMGIRFDHLEGESTYRHELEATIEAVRKQPGTRIDDGAELIDMPRPDQAPPALLKTRDGTTLYLTRDIAAARDRFGRFAFARALYVVAADQSLHFTQLFGALAAMGHDWSDRLQHVEFGRIHGMSTRKGQIVFLHQVLDDAVAKAKAACAESDKIDQARLDETAEAIGIGAIVFGDLRNLRASDYTFRWEEVLDFNGHTGPYVQFSHARVSSILRKAPRAPDPAQAAVLDLPEETALLLALAEYPEAVREAVDRDEPSVLTRALIEVAARTASYLSAGNQDKTKRVILEGDDPRMAARLALVDVVRNVLSDGLTLLGVRAPDAM